MNANRTILRSIAFTLRASTTLPHHEPAISSAYGSDRGQRIARHSRSVDHHHDPRFDPSAIPFGRQDFGHMGQGVPMALRSVTRSQGPGERGSRNLIRRGFESSVHFRHHGAL